MVWELSAYSLAESADTNQIAIRCILMRKSHVVTCVYLGAGMKHEYSFVGILHGATVLAKSDRRLW